jgi:hypothetical protein
MAIATTAINVTTFGKGNATSQWQINATSADASGCEEIKAAPGSGYTLVIKRLVIYIGAAITVTIGNGVNAGAVQTTLIGPVGGAAGTYILDCTQHPIISTSNKSLTVDASGAGAICVYVEGYTTVG